MGRTESAKINGNNVNISKAETYQIESALMNNEVYLTSNIKII